MSVAMIVMLLGGLGLFLYGMMVMSEGLQQVAGDKLREFLRTLTKNRFAGVFTGFSVTTVIQSSSATTVMLVGFVNAGLLDLTQAIGVVMGANIGTTMTGWLVSLLGFKVKIASLALPAVGIGFFVRFIGKAKLTRWGQVLLGFGLLFLGLVYMKDSVAELKKSQEIMSWISSMHVSGLGGYFLAVIVGSAVTMIIQSSSATMALTMTFAQQGMIDFPTAAALILGENIGTTITANLAAIGGNRTAKQTAFVHFMFNVAGVLWMMAAFWFFTPLVDWLVPGDAFSQDLAVRSAAIPNHMAAFHTMFNITNTLLFIGFVPYLASIAKKVFKDQESESRSRGPKLKFFRSDLIATPALALEELRQSLVYMGRRAQEGLDTVTELLLNPDDKDFDRKSQDVTEVEQELDDIEEELVRFSIDIGGEKKDRVTSEEIVHIGGSAHDFERIGDHLKILLALARTRKRKGMELTEGALEELRHLAADVHDIVCLVSQNVVSPKRNMLRDAHVLEDSINRRRDEMRKNHIKRLSAGQCELKSGILFLQVLTSMEKIGDHAFNVAQDFAPKEQV